MGIIRTNDLHKNKPRVVVTSHTTFVIRYSKGHVLVRPNDVGRWQSLSDMALGVNTELAYYKDEEEDNDKDTCNGGEAKGYAQLLLWFGLFV